MAVQSRNIEAEMMIGLAMLLHTAPAPNLNFYICETGVWWILKSTAGLPHHQCATFCTNLPLCPSTNIPICNVLACHYISFPVHQQKGRFCVGKDKAGKRGKAMTLRQVGRIKGITVLKNIRIWIEEPKSQEAEAFPCFLRLLLLLKRKICRTCSSYLCRCYHRVYMELWAKRCPGRPLLCWFTTMVTTTCFKSFAPFTV